MKKLMGSSNNMDNKKYFQENFVYKLKWIQALKFLCIILLIAIPSLGQNPDINLTNNITSIPTNETTLAADDHTSMANSTNVSSIQTNNTEINITSLLNEENLKTAIPDALIVLPEQICPETAVVSMAAIYNNTSAIFEINNTNFTGDNVTIEVFSIEKDRDYLEYAIRPVQVILNNLSIGKHQLDIKDKLTGLSLYNSTFYIRPFGQLFNGNGIIGNLQTYKGGLVNGTMYLAQSPLNPVCAPGLFNYTHVWANSTDQFVLGFNISNTGNDTQQINLSIQSANTGLKISPSYGLFESLSKDSSALMLFKVESTDLSPEIYDLTYNLTYINNSINQSLNGVLHIGIYSMNMSFETNETVNTQFISPFNDRINQSAQEWNSYPVFGNASISFPEKVFYKASYSNFTLQEPNSPWLHVLVGAAVGSVIGSGTELAHQCLYQQGLSLMEAFQPGKCQVDWASVVYEAGKTGIAGGITATLGPAVIPSVIAGIEESAFIESGMQYFELASGNRESMDLGEIAFAGVQGASDGVIVCGASKAASGIAAKMHDMGKGLQIPKSPGFLKDAYKYIKESLKSTTAEKVVKAVERSQFAKDASDYGPRAFQSGFIIGDRIGEYIIKNAFQDKSGTQLIEVSGQYLGFNSPKVDKSYIEKQILDNSDKAAQTLESPKAPIKDIKLNGTIIGTLIGNDSNAIAYGIRVISINRTFNESTIKDGDEIFLLNKSLCRDDIAPAGSIYPTDWLPSAGDYVEVYARPSAFDSNLTALGLNSSTKIITLCGEYGFYLRLRDIHPPVLSNGASSPKYGKSTDDYTFSVIYKDEDGDEPSLADVRIIGFNGTKKIFDSPYTDMTWVSGDIKTGAKYEYTTSLPPGEYHYYFFFGNQKNSRMYLPENGYPGFFGPIVGMSWPLEPFDKAHPVILGYGDFSLFGVHNAVDILCRAGEGAYAVESGTVVRSDKNKAGQTDETLYIKGDYSNKIIQYTHISILNSLKKDGARVNARDFIGTVKVSDESGFISPHLHFAIVGDDIGDGDYVPGFENPLLLLEPRADYGEPPKVNEIAFREDDAGKNESVKLGYFKKNQDGVYEVCGKVDIVANVADAMGASETAGAYKIGYSIRGMDNNSKEIDGILVEWNEPIKDVIAPLNIVYELHPGYPRSSYYNSWYIVTNSKAIVNQSESGKLSALSTDGCWNTSSVSPGLYEVTVSAWDARGSVIGSKTVKVLVTDSGSCKLPQATDQMSARIIEPLYLPQGDYTSGDIVPVNFTVVNTGKPAILYALASVRGPDGIWRQMHENLGLRNGTFGNSVLKFQINSGDIKFNTFAWAVTKNTTPGRYDVHIEVRSNEMGGEKAGLLDERDNFSQFAVPEARMRVDLHPEKTTYHPGEVARIEADIVNELGENVSVWPEVLFRDIMGDVAIYRPLTNVTPSHAELNTGETQLMSIQLALPKNAPLGDYEISVDCYEDENLTRKYRDNIDWAHAFQAAKPVNITPIDVIMVLDRSGSMGEVDPVCDDSKIEMVKDAASFAATDALNSGPGNRVGLVSFCHYSSNDIDLTRDQNAISEKINALQAGGDTSYGAGLQEALNQMVTHGNYTSIPVILFMSDGLHNTWPNTEDYVPEYTGRGIKIFTMGVGNGYDHSLLEWMADETGGEYKSIEDCSELKKVFWTVQNLATGFSDFEVITDLAQDSEVNATIFEIPPGTRQLNLTLDAKEDLSDYLVYGPDHQPAAFDETDGTPRVLTFNNPQPGNYTIVFWRTPESLNQNANGISIPGPDNSIQNTSGNTTGSGQLKVMSANPFLTNLIFPIQTAIAQDQANSSEPVGLDKILASESNATNSTGNSSSVYGYVKKKLSEVMREKADQSYPVWPKIVDFPPDAEYLKITIVASKGPVNITILDQDRKPVNPVIYHTNTSPETIILENPRAGKHTLLLYGIAEGDELYLSKYDRPPLPSRDVIRIKEMSGQDLADYPVLIQLAGKDFPTNARSDGSDISFFDDGGNQLKYWVEDWNSDAMTAKIWVKLSSLPANSERNISMRSGTSGASGSDGFSVFDFFDDFEDGALDTNRWMTSSGTRTYVGEHDGVAEIRADARTRTDADLISTESFKPNVTMVYRSYVSRGQIGDCKGLGLIGSNVMEDPNKVLSGVYWRGQKTDLFDNYRYLTGKGLMEGNSKKFKSNYEEGWRTWEVKWLDSGIDYGIDSTVIPFKTIDKSTTSIAPRFSINTTVTSLPSNILVDWVLVRHCASKEPKVVFLKASTEGV